MSPSPLTWALACALLGQLPQSSPAPATVGGPDGLGVPALNSTNEGLTIPSSNLESVTPQAVPQAGTTQPSTQSAPATVDSNPFRFENKTLERIGQYSQVPPTSSPHAIRVFAANFRGAFTQGNAAMAVQAIIESLKPKATPSTRNALTLDEVGKILRTRSANDTHLVVGAWDEITGEVAWNAWEGSDKPILQRRTEQSSPGEHVVIDRVALLLGGYKVEAQIYPCLDLDPDQANPRSELGVRILRPR